MNLGTFPKSNRARKRTRFSFYAIHDTQRLKHLVVLGKTGMGKSTALTNYALQDIQNGLGCFFIDPHETDAEQLMQLIPAHRRKDVIFFNPTEFPIAFNILDNVPKERWPFLASSVVDMIKAVFNMSNAPNVEMFAYTAIAALLETPGSTLLGLNYLLTKSDYRDQVIEKITDPIIQDFWKDFFASLPEKEKRDRPLSTINKMIQLIADPTIRNCIGQSRSAFNFADVLEHNKIVIASLPLGKLGLNKTRILVGLLFSYFHVASLARYGDRHLFPVYINEAHHFINETVCEALTGLRKFGISLTLSFHSLGEIEDPRLRARVIGSVDTLLCFRLGPLRLLIGALAICQKQFDTKAVSDL